MGSKFLLQFQLVVRGPGPVSREFKKTTTTTATATATSLNKRFNEQNNSCARAF